MLNEMKSSSAGDGNNNQPNSPDLASQSQALEPESNNQTSSGKPPSTGPGHVKRKLSLTKMLVAGIVILITLFAIGLISYLMMGNSQNKSSKEITSFEECVAAGYPIMESYPKQCAANGQTFTRELTDEEIRNKKIEPIDEWRFMFESELGYIIKIPTDVEYTSNRFFIFGDKNRKDTADGFGPNLAIYKRSGNTATEAAVAELGDDIKFTPININNATGVSIKHNSTFLFDYYLISEDGNLVRAICSSQDYSPEVSEDSISKMKTYAEKMINTFQFRNEKANLDLKNWKSFENKTYNYSLQHPDYLNTYCENGSEESCWLDGFFQGRGSENSIIIEVVPTNEDSRGTSFNNKYIDKMISAEINENFTTSEDESRIDYWGYTRLPNTKVDGIDSYQFKEYKYIWESSPETTRRTTIVPTDNYYYVINGFLESKDISLEQYNKILTTFQFTE